MQETFDIILDGKVVGTISTSMNLTVPEKEIMQALRTNQLKVHGETKGPLRVATFIAGLKVMKVIE